MKRKLFLIIFCIFSFAAALTFAPQAKAGDNFFSKFTNSVKEKVERFYLKFIPGDKSAEAVLRQSVLAMQGLSSALLSSEIKAEFLEGQVKVTSLNLKSNGSCEFSEMYDWQNSKASLALEAELSLEGMILEAALDLKKDENKTYLHFKKLPALPFVNIEKLKQGWLELDNQSTQLAEDQDAQDQALTASQREQINQATLDFFKSLDLGKAKKEKKDDHDVFVIETTVPDEKILFYYQNLAKIINQNLETATQDFQESAEFKSLQRFLDSAEEIKISIWIDRGNFYLRHLSIPISINLKELQSEKQSLEQISNISNFNLLTSIEAADQLLLNFNTDFDQFNQDFYFTAPTESQPFQEVFGAAFALNGPLTSEDEAKLQHEFEDLPELPELTEEQLNLLEEFEAGSEVEE
ncbi:MAG: hypothetical protein PVJ09_02535 [Candidatus Woesebacteria bacterium]|jgi:hypothetical protein